LSSQDTKAEQLWFNTFDVERDVRDISEFETVFHLLSLYDDLNGLLLDVGCGYGGFNNYFIANGFDVVGVDVSKTMLQRNHGCHVVLADALNLPFQPHAFAYIFCAGVLHHFRHLASVILEMQRVLKGNGRLFIYEPNGSNLLLKLSNVLAHRILSRRQLGTFGATCNETLHTLKTYVLALMQYGLKVRVELTVFVRGRTFLPFKLDDVAALFHAVAPSTITNSHILIVAEGVDKRELD